jgi:hypothetical protein
MPPPPDPATQTPVTRTEQPPLTSIAGQAKFAGCLAIVHIARQTLQSILPASVALAPGDSPAYPCLLVFGEQSDGTTFFGGLPVPWGIRYHEFMVAIPGVSWHGASGEHLFVSGMICDFPPAVWNGNFYYGFRKRLARMSWNGKRFVVVDDTHRTGFEATLLPRSASLGPALDQIRAAAALSVIGQRHDGVFARSRFEWEFREAAIEPVSLRFALGQRFRELPLGAQTGCSDDAYRVQGMRWRLSWPTTAAT